LGAHVAEANAAKARCVVVGCKAGDRDVAGDAVVQRAGGKYGIKRYGG